MSHQAINYLSQNLFGGIFKKLFFLSVLGNNNEVQ